MGNLEDRLRETFYYTNMFKRSSIYDTEIIDHAIDRIKEAFEEDEEWFHRGKVVLREDATDYIPVESNTISSDPHVAYNQGLMWATEYIVKKRADT